MKIKISGLLFFFIIQTQLFSQTLYLKVQGGYGLGTAPGTINSYDESTNSIESQNYSLGQGGNYSASLGYYVTNNAAFDLEFNYHTGSVFTSKRYTTSTEIAGTSFSVIPSFLIQTELLSINPYVKVGAIISFPSMTEKNNYQFQGPSGIENLESSYNYTGGISFGVSSAMGIMYRISDGINILFEVNNKNLSYSPKKGELEKATINGVTILEYYPRAIKEFEFVKKTEPRNDNEPGNRAAEQYPFSSLSFLMGVSVEL